MAFGDVLKNNLYKLKNSNPGKAGKDAFWLVLKNVAIEEIKALNGAKVDSDIAIEVYYKILCDNSNMLPKELSVKLPSNKQEKFRVINRNMWSSNADHKDGLANIEGILAVKEINRTKKGYRWVFSWKGDNI